MFNAGLLRDCGLGEPLQKNPAAFAKMYLEAGLLCDPGLGEPLQKNPEAFAKMSIKAGLLRDPGLGEQLQKNPEAFAKPGIFCFPENFQASLKFSGKQKILSEKPERIHLSGWQDSNLRPPAPKAGAITGLRYTPKRCLQI